jgi:hypothetical protein
MTENEKILRKKLTDAGVPDEIADQFVAEAVRTGEIDQMTDATVKTVNLSEIAETREERLRIGFALLLSAAGMYKDKAEYTAGVVNAIAGLRDDAHEIAALVSGLAIGVCVTLDADEARENNLNPRSFLGHVEHLLPEDEAFHKLLDGWAEVERLNAQLKLEMGGE